MGPKVKVLRLDSRSGLIKARMAGAAYSTGEVINYIMSVFANWTCLPHCLLLQILETFIIRYLIPQFDPYFQFGNIFINLFVSYFFLTG